jgi:hypothetical protein
VASLYKNTSRAWPLTYGSTGSFISRGTNSEDVGFLEDVVRDARVFDRGRKGDEDCAGEAGGGEDVDAPEKAGWEGDKVAEVSDAADWERPEIGTVRFWRF